MGNSHRRHGHLSGRSVGVPQVHNAELRRGVGGGQPTDTGSLTVLDPNGGVERTWTVEGCLRRKLTAVHLVRLNEGETLETGREVQLSIDWDRRADHVCRTFLVLKRYTDKE